MQWVSCRTMMKTLFLQVSCSMMEILLSVIPSVFSWSMTGRGSSLAAFLLPRPSPLTMGGLWWAYPPKQTSKTPKLKHGTLWISGVSVNFIISNPPKQTQSPLAELQSPPIENFLATVLSRPENGVVWPIPRWTHPAWVAVVALMVTDLVSISKWRNREGHVKASVFLPISGPSARGFETVR